MPVIALGLLAFSTALLTIRLVKGPSVADRVVALDTLLLVVVGVLIVEAARTGRTTFIDAVVVIGLLGFIGTGIAARFIERKGA